MNFETWIALAATVAGVALLPGPSSLLIAAQARALGLGPALAALGGDLLACALMVALVGAGLGQALAAFPEVLGAVRIMGFAWLGWIVWRALARRGAADAPTPRASAVALFAQGFLTCVANPKLILHLAAFLPLFIDPARPLVSQLVLIGATQVLIDGLVLGAWAFAAASMRRDRCGPTLPGSLDRLRRRLSFGRAAACGRSRNSVGPVNLGQAPRGVSPGRLKDQLG
jgi:homoserine/homoserine lactone efflux protein